MLCKVNLVRLMDVLERYGCVAVDDHVGSYYHYYYRLGINAYDGWWYPMFELAAALWQRGYYVEFNPKEELVRCWKGSERFEGEGWEGDEVLGFPINQKEVKILPSVRTPHPVKVSHPSLVGVYNYRGTLVMAAPALVMVFNSGSPTFYYGDKFAIKIGDTEMAYENPHDMISCTWREMVNGETPPL